MRIWSDKNTSIYQPIAQETATLLTGEWNLSHEISRGQIHLIWDSGCWLEELNLSVGRPVLQYAASVITVRSRCGDKSESRVKAEVNWVKREEAIVKGKQIIVVNQDDSGWCFPPRPHCSTFFIQFWQQSQTQSNYTLIACVCLCFMLVSKSWLCGNAIKSWNVTRNHGGGSLNLTANSCLLQCTFALLTMISISYDDMILKVISETEDHDESELLIVKSSRWSTHLNLEVKLTASACEMLLIITYCTGKL